MQGVPCLWLPPLWANRKRLSPLVELRHTCITRTAIHLNDHKMNIMPHKGMFTQSRFVAEMSTTKNQIHTSEFRFSAACAWISASLIQMNGTVGEMYRKVMWMCRAPVDFIGARSCVAFPSCRKLAPTLQGETSVCRLCNVILTSPLDHLFLTSVLFPFSSLGADYSWTRRRPFSCLWTRGAWLVYPLPSWIYTSRRKMKTASCIWCMPPRKPLVNDPAYWLVCTRRYWHPHI